MGSVFSKVVDIYLNSDKIKEYMVTPIWQQVGYLKDYNSNMKTLQAETQALGVRKTKVQNSVNAAKTNGQSIEPGVGSWVTPAESWLTNVNRIIEAVEKFLKDEETLRNRWLGRWCPDKISHYWSSRKAKKNTQCLIGLRVENAWLDFSGFQSRMQIMDSMVAALKDDKIHAIGLSGFGGVGKAEMAKHVGERAKLETLFDKIVVAVVTQDVKMKEIQGQIADGLDLTLKEENVHGRARRLRKELMSYRTVLVILVDVWKFFDLEKLGIPFGQHQGCKVMLTSGNQYVCSEMKAVKNFTVGMLPETEAWTLFKEMIGNSFEDPHLELIAKEIVKECGGLPFAIVTAGRKLRGKKDYWLRDALRQLKLQSPENSCPEILAEVYNKLKLHYNLLESREVKLCLFLCCKYEKDADIPVDDLVRDAKDQGLFEGISSLDEVSDSISTSVDKLKHCFLLLDSDKERYVKMNHRVRDIMRSIDIAAGEKIKEKKM